jgi:hypothetical protein
MAVRIQIAIFWICMRAIRKVSRVYFWYLMPCKPAHNWSPIICSCLLLSDLWCVLRLIIPPATVYGQNVMSEGTVRQWCKMFRDGWTNVHDEERSGRPSVVSDDLVQSVEQKICERWRFTISELLYEFPCISRTVLYEINTDRLGYHKFCARWVSKRDWAKWWQTCLTQAYKKLIPPMQVPQFRQWLRWDVV